MDQNNEAMVNEYINVLLKKVNDTSLELVMAQTKVNLATKEREQALKTIETLQKDLEDSKAEVLREREKPPEIKEVIKEVVVEKEVNMDTALKKEVDFLKKELAQAERKIEKLKSSNKEIANGGGNQTEEIGDSQFSTDYK